MASRTTVEISDHPSGERWQPGLKDSLVDLVKDRDDKRLMAMGGVEALARLLHTDIRQGLSGVELLTLSERQRIFGVNKLPEKKLKSYFAHLLDALSDSTIIILIVAAFVSLLFGLFLSHEENGWLEGVAICFAVVVVASVASIQNWSKDRQFAALNRVKQDRMVVVKRNGQLVQTSIYDLVVGDVVDLSNGAEVPCDGIFIFGHELSLDEASMTGESVAVRKTLERPFLLAGTNVATGSGQFLAIAVGQATEHGRLVGLLDEAEPENTPLQDKLTALAEDIGKIGTAVAVVTYIVMCTSFGAHYAFDAQKSFSSDRIRDLLQFFVVAVTIVVVAVPEGLPLAVTISLAFSMKKMIEDKNLVRELAACETMGGATNICSDKTGTLTQNRMTVVEGWFFGQHYPRLPNSLPGDLTDFLCRAAAVDGKAEVNFVDAQGNHLDRPKITGSPTEAALLYMVNVAFGRDWRHLRETYAAQERVVMRREFSSARKRSGIVLPSEKGSGFDMYVKGASEYVLRMCTHFMDARGASIELDDQLQNNLLQMINNMADQGLRTIGMAYRHLDRAYNWEDEFDALESNMVFFTLVGIEDPIRPEVPRAVQLCQAAGITVRMVTGDNKNTARKIASQCGIFTGGLVMEGPDFRKLSTAELRKTVRKLQVLARSSPEDKYLMVKTLKDLGEVVSVTGDGTNDAPALKLAHVGLAMGSGTDIARDASKIIIMDDNFASIVRAVVWGRSVFDNIRKFLQFQLTINVCALGVTFIAKAAQREDFPLTAVQLLWVNLIMDSFAALALATEPPEESLLYRPPQGKKEPLITVRMWKMLVGQGVLQIIILCLLLFAGNVVYNIQMNSVHHYTIIFNSFVFMQVANIFNARKLVDVWNVFSGVLKGFWFVLIVLVIIGGQALIVNVGGPFTNTEKLTGPEWLGSVVTGCFSFINYFILLVLPFGRVAPPLPPPNLPPIGEPGQSYDSNAAAAAGGSRSLPPPAPASHGKPSNLLDEELHSSEDEAAAVAPASVAGTSGGKRQR